MKPPLRGQSLSTSSCPQEKKTIKSPESTVDTSQVAQNKLKALLKLQSLSSKYIPNYEGSSAAEEMVSIGKKLKVLANPENTDD